jgi:hypothetical protein
MANVSTDIGGEVKLLTAKVAPAQVAGTITTPWVAVKSGDIEGAFESVILSGVLGTAANTPTTQSLTLKLQDATDSSGTGSADLKDESGSTIQSVAGIAAAAPGSTNGAVTQLNGRIKNARAFVRGVGTLVFTGGSTPTNDVALTLHAGGGPRTPITPPNP